MRPATRSAVRRSSSTRGHGSFGRKVIVPAGTIERADFDTSTVHVALTKDQIKSSPEFDAERGWRNEDYRNRLGEYYAGRRAS